MAMTLAEFITYLNSKVYTNTNNEITAEMVHDAIQALAEEYASPLLTGLASSKADKTITLSGSGLLTVSSPGTLEANRTLTVPIATVGEAQAGTEAAKAMTPERTTDHFNQRTTVFTRTILDDANQAAVQTTLGLVPGTNVQAYDADLLAIAALASTGLLKRTGTNTWSLLASTTFGESLINVANASTLLTLIGVDKIKYTAQRAVNDVDMLAGVFNNYMSTYTGGYALNTSGVPIPAGIYRVSDYIEVDERHCITHFGAKIVSGTYVPFAFYDAAFGFLGYAYNPSTDDVHIYDVANAPSGTKYVRLSGYPNVECYIYNKFTIQTERDKLFSLYGLPINNNTSSLINQYIIKSTGVTTNSNTWRLTSKFAVTGNSYIASMGGLVSNADTARCQYAFYDASGTYLGYYNAKAKGQIIRVDTLFPTATSVRITMPAADVGEVYILNATEGFDRALDMVTHGGIVDYFALSDIEAERLNLTGSTTQHGHEYWRTTPYIPVKEGQVAFVSAQNVTGLGAVVAGYNSDQVWVSNLLAGATKDNFLNYRLVIPTGISYIRATFRNDTTPYRCELVQSVKALEEGNVTDIINLAPEDVYGRTDKPVYVFARGIVGDRAIPVAFAPNTGSFTKFYGDEKLRIEKGDTEEATFKVHAIAGSKTLDIATVNLRMVDTNALVSPSVPMNIVVIGDSTTSQLDTSGDPNAIDGDGTVVNEFSRQLTGVGIQALTPDVARMIISEPFVAGNSISGTITDGVTPKTVGPIAFDTNSNTTLSNLAAAIQAKLLEYEAAAGSTAVRSGSTTILVTLKTPITFTGFVVTGGASQPTFSDTFTPYSGGPEVNTGREWGPVVDADIRQAFGLTNIHFRGTRGTGIIKHEGRGGWKPISYLERTDVVGGDGKFNAFWDPSLAPWGPEGTTWQFSMKYFIESNGWDFGTIVSGVVEGGSNLLVIIALGWNDYGGNVGAGPSSTYIAAIMDQIHAEYPDATIWITSLWAPREGIFQSNTSTAVTKFYSAADVFRDAVYAYGNAYRKICADRPYSKFIQLSHQMDPDYCFSKSTMVPNPVANDPSLNILGTASIVHMRRRGYAMNANILADAFLYYYCQ